MCTLKPPFDANSLQQLAKKIAKGIYAPIPTTYSKEMKNLVNICLVTDTKKRPRVHELLAMPIIKNRIKEFLTTTIANIEFNHTVIHKKDLYQIHNDEKENRSSGSNLRSNSRASIENNDAIKKSNDDDRLKIEREKQKAEELAKKQK